MLAKCAWWELIESRRSMSSNDTGVGVKAHISTSGSQGDTHADGRVHCRSKVAYCIVVGGRHRAAHGTGDPYCRGCLTETQQQNGSRVFKRNKVPFLKRKLKKEKEKKKKSFWRVRGKISGNRSTEGVQGGTLTYPRCKSINVPKRQPSLAVLTSSSSSQTLLQVVKSPCPSDNLH